MRCFNKLKRPKLEVFKGCFSGNISPTDVDMQVEKNGNFLVVDFKSNIDHYPPKNGQRRMFEKQSRCVGYTVMLVECDEETMVCTGVRRFRNGQILDREDADLDGVKEIFREWYSHAVHNPTNQWKARDLFERYARAIRIALGREQ